MIRRKSIIRKIEFSYYKGVIRRIVEVWEKDGRGKVEGMDTWTDILEGSSSEMMSGNLNFVICTVRAKGVRL